MLKPHAFTGASIIWKRMAGDAWRRESVACGDAEPELQVPEPEGVEVQGSDAQDVGVGWRSDAKRGVPSSARTHTDTPHNFMTDTCAHTSSGHTKGT